MRRKGNRVATDSAEPEHDTTFGRIEKIDGRAIGFPNRFAERTTFLMSFDGCGDFVRSSEKCLGRCDLYDYTYLFQEAAWIGKKFSTYKDVIRTVDETDTRTVDDVLRMADELERDVPAPIEIKRRRVWDEYAGDEIDVDRFRVAEPFFRTNAKRPRVGPRVASLLVQCGANSFMESTAMKWRGAACIALARILESAGYCCEIRSVTLGAFVARPLVKADEDGANVATVCELKRAGDSLDVAALVNATSGWFFRSVVFGAYSNLNRPLDSHLGQMQEANERTAQYFAGSEAPWLIAGVYDYESAKRLAAALLDTLQAKGE